jgi:hypothetical protein
MIDWEDYTSKKKVFDSLTDINRFALVADIPPLPQVGESSFASLLSTGLYAAMEKAIGSAKFFNEDQLELISGPGNAGVTYRDDRYDFALKVTSSTLSIERSGSPFEDFHYWYTGLMPQMPALMATALDVLTKLADREFRMLRASYNFSFILHSLAHAESNRRMRNYEVMQKLIRGIPSDAGLLTEDEDVVRAAGRIDVNISRWVKETGPWRRLRYSAEAPANKEGAGLWLTFGYGGETYSDPDSRIRARFSHREFLGEWDRAYMQFLRDRAILGFLETLMRGVTFKTTAGSLP